jgi:hypothetical protein
LVAEIKKVQYFLKMLKVEKCLNENAKGPKSEQKY